MAGFEQYLSRTKGEISVSACSVGGQPPPTPAPGKACFVFSCYLANAHGRPTPPQSTSCSALLGISQYLISISKCLGVGKQLNNKILPQLKWHEEAPVD